MAALTLYLVRHPEPDIAPGICYGRLDVPARNVEAAAARLRADLPAGLPVWSSPLQRCRMLAEALHPMPIVDERLVEMNFGTWEGRAWDAIPRAELDAWAADIGNYTPPGGESARFVQQRVISFIGAMAGDQAIVVAHAGIFRVLVAAQLGLPPERWFELEFPYATRTLLQIYR